MNTKPDTFRGLVTHVEEYKLGYILSFCILISLDLIPWEPVRVVAFIVALALGVYTWWVSRRRCDCGQVTLRNADGITIRNVMHRSDECTDLRGARWWRDAE